MTLEEAASVLRDERNRLNFKAANLRERGKYVMAAQEQVSADAMDILLAEREECQREHPPEPQYVAWCEAGKGEDYAAAVAEVQKYAGHHPGLSLAENVREMVKDIADADESAARFQQGKLASEAEAQALREALTELESSLVRGLEQGGPNVRLSVSDLLAAVRALAGKARP